MSAAWGRMSYVAAQQGQQGHGQGPAMVSTSQQSAQRCLDTVARWSQKSFEALSMLQSQQRGYGLDEKGLPDARQPLYSCPVCKIVRLGLERQTHHVDCGLLVLLKSYSREVQPACETLSGEASSAGRGVSTDGGEGGGGGGSRDYYTGMVMPAGNGSAAASGTRKEYVSNGRRFGAGSHGTSWSPVAGGGEEYWDKYKYGGSGSALSGLSTAARDTASVVWDQGSRALRKHSNSEVAGRGSVPMSVAVAAAAVAEEAARSGGGGTGYRCGERTSTRDGSGGDGGGGGGDEQGSGTAAVVPKRRARRQRTRSRSNSTGRGKSRSHSRSRSRERSSSHGESKTTRRRGGGGGGGSGADGHHGGDVSAATDALVQMGSPTGARGGGRTSSAGIGGGLRPEWKAATGEERVEFLLEDAVRKAGGGGGNDNEEDKEDSGDSVLLGAPAFDKGGQLLGFYATVSSDAALDSAGDLDAPDKKYLQERLAAAIGRTNDRNFESPPDDRLVALAPLSPFGRDPPKVFRRADFEDLRAFKHMALGVALRTA
ncbi:unnamed protein product [Phaeothamnion confervicola]